MENKDPNYNRRKGRSTKNEMRTFLQAPSTSRYSLVYGPSLAGPNYSLKKQSSVFVPDYLLLPPCLCYRWSAKRRQKSLATDQVLASNISTFIGPCPAGNSKGGGGGALFCYSPFAVTKDKSTTTTSKNTVFMLASFHAFLRIFTELCLYFQKL